MSRNSFFKGGGGGGFKVLGSEKWILPLDQWQQEEIPSIFIITGVLSDSGTSPKILGLGVMVFESTYFYYTLSVCKLRFKAGKRLCVEASDLSEEVFC